MSSHIRILGIAGSFRRGSWNQAALRAAKLLAPENCEIDIFQLDQIPMFNQEDEKCPPSSVVELKKRIRRADAVLILTPEYNYSIPGVLKNAIDWRLGPMATTPGLENQRRSWARLSAQSAPLEPISFLRRRAPLAPLFEVPA
jgi:NAD(P)H-dependent FMN reductase